MKSERISRLLTRLMAIGLFALLLAACSKREDDMVCPQDHGTSEGITKSMSTGSLDQAADAAKGTPGISNRDPEEGDTGGDEGISDDGDDEADGEGSNKKNKNTH